MPVRFAAGTLQTVSARKFFGPAMVLVPGWLFLLVWSLLMLAGCAQHEFYNGAGSGEAYAPTHYYPPPGPPDDPWGPYVQEAAARYSIPQQWIRAVMAQESGGEEQAVSPVGAMGLMQIMPGTYDELRDENGLGPDPFNPEDNILAGAAYIREMYDRYGSPGFLAAYNAGPEAVDSYLAGQSGLPDETVNYLAAVTPNLGNALPMSGALANYEVASAAAPASTPSAVGFATGCDVNAAYDPDHPCTADMANRIAATEQSASSGSCDLNAAYDPDSPCTHGSGTQAASGSCDLDRAYDPDSRCAPAGAAAPAVPSVAQVRQAIAQAGTTGCNPDAAYDPDAPCTPAAALASNAVTPPAGQPAPAALSGSMLYQPPGVAPAPVSAAPAPVLMPAVAASLPAGGAWAIQVGAFSNAALARTVAEGVRAELPGALSAATIELPATSPFGGLVLYRARLANLSAQAAANACSQLNAKQLPCIVVPASAA
ncbi:MAG TPA: lytic transglycosylase domain-containing protein [Acidocella sp.]|jgi:hypothetical protein|nr:lytic transglycosylase domain-containing protein [Acidocella sp.]